MIEPQAVAPDRTDRSGQQQCSLPVRPATGRLMVLAGVFLCAACGLVYELELVALASYLIGDSVTQASVVLSVMVFAMGLGSLFAKHLRPRAALSFGVLESVLALVGGGSALALSAAFAFLGGPDGVWPAATRWMLVLFSLLIGVLIGAEIPLLMVMIQRIRRQDAGGAVADLFAADYVGALVGGLAFPFLLLPWLGGLSGVLLTGAVNVIAGGALVLGLFRGDLGVRGWWGLLLTNVLVLSLLAGAAALVDDFEDAARRAVYGPAVRVVVSDGMQEIAVTGPADGPFDLWLDGRLRVSAREQGGYHRALVGPAMRGQHDRVLVLGGGDGLAAAEVLRHPGVRDVDVVDGDPELVRLARTDPALSRTGGQALADPRVHVSNADPFDWLRRQGRVYDVVVGDLPGPVGTDADRLYTQEFFGLVARALSPGGHLAVHAGPPAAEAHDFWTAEAGIRAAGLRTEPYALGRSEGMSDAGTAADGLAPAPPERGFLLGAHSAAELSSALPGGPGGFAPAHGPTGVEAGAARPGGGGSERDGRSGCGGDGPGPAVGNGALAGPGGLGAEPRLVPIEDRRIPGLPPSTLTRPRYGG